MQGKGPAWSSPKQTRLRRYLIKQANLQQNPRETGGLQMFGPVDTWSEGFRERNAADICFLPLSVPAVWWDLQHRSCRVEASEDSVSRMLSSRGCSVIHCSEESSVVTLLWELHCLKHRASISWGHQDPECHTSRWILLPAKSHQMLFLQLSDALLFPLPTFSVVSSSFVSWKLYFASNCSD